MNHIGLKRSDANGIGRRRLDHEGDRQNGHADCHAQASNPRIEHARGAVDFRVSSYERGAGLWT
jgi:hypothetical protein